jgi:hypothetical protein
MVIPNAISREQAYLASLTSQPKDIHPSQLYEVSRDLPSSDSVY